MRARREVVSAVAERYRATGRSEKGRILDELCSVAGWHRKHAIRVLSPRGKSVSAQQRQRHRTYGPSIRDALRPGREPKSPGRMPRALSCNGLLRAIRTQQIGRGIYIATVVGPLPPEVAADIEPAPVIDHRRRHHRRRWPRNIGCRCWICHCGQSQRSDTKCQCSVHDRTPTLGFTGSHVLWPSTSSRPSAQKAQFAEKARRIPLRRQFTYCVQYLDARLITALASTASPQFMTY
jgi:hypothetical protein